MRADEELLGVLASARKRDIQKDEDEEQAAEDEMDSSTSEVNLTDVSVDGDVGSSAPSIASLAPAVLSAEPEATSDRGGFMAHGQSSNSTFDESSQNDTESRVVRVGDEILKAGSPNTSLGARAFLLQQGLQQQVKNALRTTK